MKQKTRRVRNETGHRLHYGPAIAVASALVFAGSAAAAQQAGQGMDCPVGHEQLVKALKASVKPSGGPSNGGLDNNEWAAVVNRDGVVCAIAYSGEQPGDQWPGSRPIAIEKASTANNFSLPQYAVSTASLWAATQPGGYLYGLAASAPPVGAELMAGKVADYGTANDPIIGKRPGGTVLFGGGLALYDGHQLVGAIGVSGDTSCADHNVAWRVRHGVGLDQVPNGPSPAHNDEIIYDVEANGQSASGWGHPKGGLHSPQIAAQIGAGTGEAAQAASAGSSHPAGSGSSNPPQQENAPSHPGQDKHLPGFLR